MPHIEIRPAELADVYRLVGTLREEDRGCLSAFGVNAKRAFRDTFKRSIWRRAGLVDGVLVAAGGLDGNWMSDEGYPWFLTSAGVEKIPLALVKHTRQWVGEMLALRSTLVDYVPEKYIRARRFVELLGFEIESQSGDLLKYVVRA